MMSERCVFVAGDLQFADNQWRRLEEAVRPDRMIVVDTSKPTEVLAALQQAEVAILSGDLDDRHLRAPGLKWVHCDHAGLTQSAKPEVFETGLIVTGSAGRSGPALAEHALMFALMLCSRYPDFYEAQKRREWRRTADMHDLRALSGRTIGILGLGHTGQALALRAKAFNMRVLGYRRRDTVVPPGVDRVYSADRGDTIDEIIEQSDVLALVLNLSDSTYRMIGREQIARMKPSAVIVNLSRGDVLDQEALIDALRHGRLAGAGLDVTVPEPLPADHPLWDTPNVLITPHFTASLPDKADRSLDVITENFRRYRAGEPMLNQITREDIWSRRE